MTSDEITLRYGCPLCKARPGQRCVSVHHKPGTRMTTNFHDARERHAYKQEEKKKNARES